MGTRGMRDIRRSLSFSSSKGQAHDTSSSNHTSRSNTPSKPVGSSSVNTGNTVSSGGRERKISYNGLLHAPPGTRDSGSRSGLRKFDTESCDNSVTSDASPPPSYDRELYDLAEGRSTYSTKGRYADAMPAARPTSTLEATHEPRVLVVGKGVTLEATVTSCDKVIVEGLFKGTITTGIFVLAEGGQMEGEVECADGRIGGTMKATVVASKTLMIGKSAVVTGDVVYEALEIVDGGRLQGKLMHFSTMKAEYSRGKQAAAVEGADATTPPTSDNTGTAA